MTSSILAYELLKVQVKVKGLASTSDTQSGRESEKREDGWRRNNRVSASKRSAASSPYQSPVSGSGIRSLTTFSFPSEPREGRGATPVSTFP